MIFSFDYFVELKLFVSKAFFISNNYMKLQIHGVIVSFNIIKVIFIFYIHIYLFLVSCAKKHKSILKYIVFIRIEIVLFLS